ncbi:MAG: 4-hydroxy-tetrahydrodipicolinate synthase [archaeon]
MPRFTGCYSAIATPMTRDNEVDYEGLRHLVNFQVKEGLKGIVAVGTTGESPTLNWEEHNDVIDKISECTGERCLTIAGTGSNSTREAIEATRHVSDLGLKCILLVDPYYNGPSSIEIRREYVEPVAQKFPEIEIIPYVIPGRTGTQLLPQDLAILHSRLPNVNAVKEATGSVDNMRLTRRLCGEDFDILSGDDDKTYIMMTDAEIDATGVISVASNVAPGAVQRYTDSILHGRKDEALQLQAALLPLFSMITVKTDEHSLFGATACKARNPVPIKTLMNILGMPSGPCRPPLGRMTNNGLQTVLNVARLIHERNPEIFRPIEQFFDVNLDKRLRDENSWRGLAYD